MMRPTIDVLAKWLLRIGAAVVCVQLFLGIRDSLQDNTDVRDQAFQAEAETFVREDMARENAAQPKELSVPPRRRKHRD